MNYVQYKYLQHCSWESVKKKEPFFGHRRSDECPRSAWSATEEKEAVVTTLLFCSLRIKGETETLDLDTTLERGCDLIALHTCTVYSKVYSLERIRKGGVDSLSGSDFV